MKPFIHSLGIILFAAVGFTLTGCSSTQKTDHLHPPPPPILPTTVNVIPAQVPMAAQPALIEQTPIPLMDQPRVRKVVLDAYINERGEAYGPQIKYVVTDPGGWNLDALRSPERSYIPAVNLPPVRTGSGVTYSPMVAPGRGAIFEPQPGDRLDTSPRVLYHMDKVRITGFVERGQETQARAMVREGENLVYDNELGFIIVPQNVLQQENSIPPPGGVFPGVSTPRTGTSGYVPAVGR